jgi:3-oxo-5alpha-steroid 4-dehydrogenase
MQTYPVIQSDSVKKWHAHCDVIVVGFGAAGSCAAIEAATAGADVLVLERASGISGTTCIATGHFYLGGGTRPQLANGLQDSVEDMFNYLVANTPQPDITKIRLYCEQSVAHFNWLVAQGVPFNDGFYRKKHYEQPTDECLIWSGNEKAWPFSQQAKPVPRGHKVENIGSEGGGLVMQKLTRAAEQLHVDFQFDARVCNLISDNQGRITGVRYTHFGEERCVAARKGVVLAAGGFAMNQAMLEEYCPKLAHPGVVKQGNPNDDGAAINLGIAAGGCVEHMDGALITAPFYPPESLLKGILVNRDGQRFINEDSYHARTMTACLDQPEGIAYLITDNACFGRPEIQMQELIDAWEDIATMEQGLKLPTGALQQTMADYNAHAAQGEDPEFHKHSDWLQPLTEAPYAALQCSLGESVYVGFTLGGLRVSAQGEALTKAGKPISGLYAAGACASNIAQDGAGYSSGTAIGESTFFGRRAGRHVATGSC